jgi:hypothetical protein
MKPNVAWPAELQRVMDQALARSVDERYQKASDFGREFSMAVEAMPASAAAAAADGATLVIGAAASAQTVPVAAVPKTRVATPRESAGVRAHTPVKSGKGMMIGIGSGVLIAGVAAYLVFGPKGSGSAGNAPPVKPDSPHVAPKTDSSGAGAAGNRNPSDGNRGTGTQSSGTKTQFNRPAGNPAGGSNPAGGGGGGVVPTGHAPTQEEQIARLDSLTIPPRLNDLSADTAITLATQLLAGGAIQGELRARILYRRAYAHLHLEHKTKGCADLDAALTLAAGAQLNSIKVFREQACDVPSFR